jgi:hypothetical protein
MPQMNLAGRRLDSQRRAGQGIVRTMHATLGRGFLVLLNSHDKLLESNSLSLAVQAGQD